MGRFPEELVSDSHELLVQLQEASPSLELAVLISDDGFEVTRVPANEDEDGLFASMASSIQALGEAVAGETELGKTDAVIIQASEGKIIQLRITEDYVLSTKFSNEDLLGRNLIHLRKLSDKLLTILR